MDDAKENRPKLGLLHRRGDMMSWREVVRGLDTFAKPLQVDEADDEDAMVAAATSRLASASVLYAWLTAWMFKSRGERKPARINVA